MSPPAAGLPLSSDRLTWLLCTIGWSSHELARQLTVGVRSVRYWLEDERPVPDAIALWLEELVAFRIAHPPPVSSRANETNT